MKKKEIRTEQIIPIMFLAIKNRRSFRDLLSFPN